VRLLRLESVQIPSSKRSIWLRTDIFAREGQPGPSSPVIFESFVLIRAQWQNRFWLLVLSIFKLTTVIQSQGKYGPIAVDAIVEVSRDAGKIEREPITPSAAREMGNVVDRHVRGIPVVSFKVRSLPRCWSLRVLLPTDRQQP